MVRLSCACRASPHLQHEVAADVLHEAARAHEGVAQRQRRDAQRQPGDVDEVDAQRGREAEPAERGALVARAGVGHQRQVALDGLFSHVGQPSHALLVKACARRSQWRYHVHGLPGHLLASEALKLQGSSATWLDRMCTGAPMAC